jgi:D-citramalate synthase
VPVARARPKYVAVMDTTLRDGEQTPDVAYTPAEKLQLARLLLEKVGVDRIEIASTRVSEGEREAAGLIARWARGARRLPRVEILGYCDEKISVDWITATGGAVLNLLVKGSELHCRSQLGMTPEAHREGVEQTIRYALRRRLSVNVYLEDWSSGITGSPAYVFAMVDLLRDLSVSRIYLPDTLGIFAPLQVSEHVTRMVKRYPDQCFEFHAHNDYGLATANCLAALAAGARGVHTSVNGMGERTGNTRLAEVVAAIHDHTALRTRVDERALSEVSRRVEIFSGKDIAANTPIVGRDVFTQTAGIHADGDLKGDLYTTRLAPGRFGQQRRYALGKLSGKASVDQNLKTLGIGLTAADRDQVLKRVIELGDQKGILSIEDLPYIIDDVLKRPEEIQVRVSSWSVQVGTGETPHAELTLEYRGRTEKARSTGDGGYDAFMKALARAAPRFKLVLPRLEDFRVRIPPGGQTAALVETVITWQPAGRGEPTFSTRGVDSDQLAAAVRATEKMLNVIAPRARRRPGRRSASRL